MALDPLYWSMFMPVVRLMAVANSSFPEGMRSRKAARRVCIHPHSMGVSFLCPRKAGLRFRSFLITCSSLFVTCPCVSIGAAVLFSPSEIFLLRQIL